MEEIEMFLRLSFMGLGIVLAGLTSAAWYKIRGWKMLLASLGFCVIAAEGVLLSAGIFSESVEELLGLPLIIGMNFLAMTLIYISFIKR